VRSALALLLAAAAASAQNPLQPTPLEIRGRVVESSANIPIDGAEITVSVLETYHWRAAKRSTTDPSGNFQLRIETAGEYQVRAEKPGYTYDGTNPIRHTPSNQERVQVDQEHPSAAVRLVLVSAGELTGHVVDADTGKPIARLPVYPITVFWSNGRPIEVGHEAAVTDKEGRFVAKRLQSGRYLVEVRPQQFDKEQLLEKYSADDLAKVDNDYQRSYWPGGGGFDLALPVQVLPGSSTDVGTIKARKGPFYRVRLSIPADGCAPGERVLINAIMVHFIDAGGGGEADCGESVLLRNFEAGEYSFYVVSGSTEADRKRVILPVEVTDRNIELSVPLARGVDIHGRIGVADGASKPPLEKLQIQMTVMGDIQFADEQEPVSPGPEGRFRFVNRPIARTRIVVSGVPANFDVQEVRYNGGAVTDSLVALNANAPVHTLEIVIDDKPARIAGTVTNGDKPMARAQAVLVKWPLSNEDVFLSLRSTAESFNLPGWLPVNTASWLLCRRVLRSWMSRTCWNNC